MKTRDKTKPGVRMWAVYLRGELTEVRFHKPAIAQWKKCGFDVVPAVLLPADAESVAALRETIARTIFETGRGSGEIWADQTPFMKEPSYIEADAALKAIGLTQPRKRKTAIGLTPATGRKGKS